MAKQLCCLAARQSRAAKSFLAFRHLIIITDIIDKNIRRIRKICEYAEPFCVNTAAPPGGGRAAAPSDSDLRAQPCFAADAFPFSRFSSAFPARIRISNRSRGAGARRACSSHSGRRPWRRAPPSPGRTPPGTGGRRRRACTSSRCRHRWRCGGSCACPR